MRGRALKEQATEVAFRPFFGKHQTSSWRPLACACSRRGVIEERKVGHLICFLSSVYYLLPTRRFQGVALKNVRCARVLRALVAPCASLYRAILRSMRVLNNIPTPVLFPRTLSVCLLLQVECNPNIFPDPFKAQVFVRIWDDKMEISSQAMLTKLTDAIKGHLALFK